MAATPQQVSEFARQYQDNYMQLCQYKAAYVILIKERDELKKQLNIKDNGKENSTAKI